MKSLYAISQDFLEIADLLEEDELTPELEERLKITREDFQEKASAYINIIKNKEAWEAQLDAEIKRLSDLKKRTVSAQDKLKSNLREAVILFGPQSIGTFELKLRKSEQVYIEDEGIIPLDYTTTKVSISKSLIKDAIKKGIEVPGASIVENQNLVIK